MSNFNLDNLDVQHHHHHYLRHYHHYHHHHHLCVLPGEDTLLVRGCWQGWLEGPGGQGQYHHCLRTRRYFWFWNFGQRHNFDRGWKVCPAGGFIIRQGRSCGDIGLWLSWKCKIWSGLTKRDIQQQLMQLRQNWELTRYCALLNQGASG